MEEEQPPKSSANFRVLMFPWLAHGHISPFIQLSKKLLLSNNCQIYFLSTKINLSFVKEIFQFEGTNPSIELLELQLPDSPDLPPQYHTTKNLPPHLMSKLMAAFQMAKSSFTTILNRLSPDLLIYDCFQSWAPSFASEKSIPAVLFVTSGAATTSFYYHTNSFNPLGDFFSSSIFLRDYEARKLQALVESNKLVADDFAFRCLDLSSEIALIKTCRDLEGKYLDYLSCSSGKEMVSLGPLIQDQESNFLQKGDDNDNQSDIIKFLSSKDQSSVVFVSFGSEYFLSDSEMEEIAHGLELSKVNFIWVIRFPVGKKMKIEDSVPKGFLEKVKNRGIMVDEWAPQARILGHKSTGGFLSHCGWSSVMESLYFGVPIIAMPMHLDQPTNARFLGEIGAGLEILRDENGKMNREAIAEAVKMVVLEKDGEGIRGKAKDLSEMFRLKGKEEEEEAMEKIWSLCSKYKQARNGNEVEVLPQEQAQVEETTVVTSYLN